MLMKNYDPLSKTPLDQFAKVSGESITLPGQAVNLELTMRRADAISRRAYAMSWREQLSDVIEDDEISYMCDIHDTIDRARYLGELIREEQSRNAKKAQDALPDAPTPLEVAINDSLTLPPSTD